MDAFDCIAYLQDAQAAGAWGEYLVQPATQNILIADVLRELGFSVRSVRWRFEVENNEGHFLDVALAIEIPVNGTPVLIEAHSGIRGHEAIERHTAAVHEVGHAQSLLAPDGLPFLEEVKPIRGIGANIDKAYDTQRALVIGLLAPVLGLENATPAVPTPRGSPRL